MKIKTKKINWETIKLFLIYCLLSMVSYTIYFFSDLIFYFLLNG